MQILTIDISNNKTMRLLHDLELLQLTQVRRDKPVDASAMDWAARYKGAMTKPLLTGMNSQLNELCNVWK